MYVRTIQHLNYGGQEIKNKQKRLAVCDSNTPVTLKQGHQNWYESVDPKQGYGNEKFEKLRSNSLRKESQHNNDCQIKKHMSYLPWIFRK